LSPIRSTVPFQVDGAATVSISAARFVPLPSSSTRPVLDRPATVIAAEPARLLPPTWTTPLLVSVPPMLMAPPLFWKFTSRYRLPPFERPVVVVRAAPLARYSCAFWPMLDRPVRPLLL